MTLVIFTVPAAPHARWTHEAAKSVVGQQFDATFEHYRTVHPMRGTVLRAKCLNDGLTLELAVEWPDA